MIAHFSVPLLTISVLSLVQPVYAQDTPDCENQMDQNTMTQCAALDFEEADAELNRIWPEIKKGAEESDDGASEGGGGYLKALMASQRAWIAYRDAECEWQGFEAHQGSMEPMLVEACRAAKTRERIKELQGEDGQQ